jgi:hypothetical protein
MPYYYDVNKTGGYTSNASAGTETYHLDVTNGANNETVGISGIFVAGRFGTAGGAQIRLKDNTGTATSGGTAVTPTPKNRRGSVVAASSWVNDATAITAGGTLLNRLTVGFAQTGGTGGWVAMEAGDKFQLMANSATAANPKDYLWSSNASSSSVTFDMTVSFSEGI